MTPTSATKQQTETNTTRTDRASERETEAVPSFLLIRSLQAHTARPHPGHRNAARPSSSCLSSALLRCCPLLTTPAKLYREPLPINDAVSCAAASSNSAQLCGAAAPLASANFCSLFARSLWGATSCGIGAGRERERREHDRHRASSKGAAIQVALGGRVGVCGRRPVAVRKRFASICCFVSVSLLANSRHPRLFFSRKFEFF